MPIISDTAVGWVDLTLNTLPLNGSWQLELIPFA